MNMETISNTDFDRLEQLLHSRQFDELSSAEKQWVKSILSEEKYKSMSILYTSLNDQNQRIEINPGPETKDSLNKSFAVKVRRPGMFQLKIPVYQSAAAALIFFLVGFGINLSRPVETKVIHDTVEVIKYMSKPENAKNSTIEAPKQEKKKHKELQVITEQKAVLITRTEDGVSNSGSNPEIIRQQDIAMTNMNKVLNEDNGSSMGGDTLLQKMLVTVY